MSANIDATKPEVGRRVVVLGLGNILNRDEGLGVHALAALPPPVPPLEFVDGGVLGLNLLPLVESCRRLLVLDAIDAGQPPGSLIELTGEAIPRYAGVKLSPHQLTFQELVGLAGFRANCRRTCICLGCNRRIYR
jgi:hydrogenase maturation protease